MVDLLHDCWPDLQASLSSDESGVLAYCVARQSDTPELPMLLVPEAPAAYTALAALVTLGLVTREERLPLYRVSLPACRARARAFRMVEAADA